MNWDGLALVRDFSLKILFRDIGYGDVPVIVEVIIMSVDVVSEQFRFGDMLKIGGDEFTG